MYGRIFSVGVVVAAAILVTNSAASGAENRFAGAMLPIALEDGRLVGSGGEALLEAASHARFILVGEEHGLAETPSIAAALWRTLPPDSHRAFVAEIGPLAAEEIERLARTGSREQWNGFYAEFPYSVAFFWFVQEMELAKEVAAGGGAIWGIDQEFVLSPQLHFVRLADEAGNPQLRRRFESFALREREAVERVVDERDPSGAGLFMLDGESWSGALPDSAALTSTARQRLDALTDSRDIYQLFNSGRPAESNRARIALMKRQLDEAVRKAGGAGRVRLLAKLGAVHAMRGHSALGYLDVGNHLAELAIYGGGASFHLLVLPVGGARNAALPFTGPEAARTPVDCPSLGPFAPLCEAASEIEGWRYLDLGPLRDGADSLFGVDAALPDLVRGFDAVIFIGRATPADLSPSSLDFITR